MLVLAIHLIVSSCASVKLLQVIKSMSEHHSDEERDHGNYHNCREMYCSISETCSKKYFVSLRGLHDCIQLSFTTTSIISTVSD